MSESLARPIPSRIRWRHEDCDPTACVATMELGCEVTQVLRLLDTCREEVRAYEPDAAKWRAASASDEGSLGLNEDLYDAIESVLARSADAGCLCDLEHLRRLWLRDRADLAARLRATPSSSEPETLR